MKKIVIFGAGRSSAALIDYLAAQAAQSDWHITIADKVAGSGLGWLRDNSRVEIAEFDLNDAQKRNRLVGEADVVISMLPPFMHAEIAGSCLAQKKHFMTASYVSEEIRAMDAEAREKDLLFLMETGLDPGIDHMSAMKEIDAIRQKGEKLRAFRSYTGGLVSPGSDTNSWHYKITWNPRNVILAGQGTATWLENGRVKYLPYHRLFGNTVGVNVEGHGMFEGYMNRDSLHYPPLYGLDTIDTFIRGTLRKAPFCEAWNCFVQLGMTSDAFTLNDSEELTWAEFAEAFLPESKGSVRERFIRCLQLEDKPEVMRLIDESGLFSDRKTGVPSATPAVLLQALFEEVWKTEPGDRDMIVMQHQFGVEKGESAYTKYSALVVCGDDRHSAMSRTVGLPLAIACRLLLEGKLSLRGVQIPVAGELYGPILQELETLGIRFEERTE